MKKIMAGVLVVAIMLIGTAGLADAATMEWIDGVVDVINSEMADAMHAEYVEESDCICVEFVLPGFTSTQWNIVMTDEEREHALSSVATIYMNIYEPFENVQNAPSLLMLSRLEDGTSVALHMDGVDISWMLN